jgi:hypothetical protein
MFHSAGDSFLSGEDKKLPDLTAQSQLSSLQFSPALPVGN